MITEKREKIQKMITISERDYMTLLAENKLLKKKIEALKQTKVKLFGIKLC